MRDFLEHLTDENAARLCKSRPIVSILIPAHRASRTIGLALASTLLTKPSNSEVLIFLDGDDTQSQFLKFASKRKDVRVFYSQKRIGIAASLNFLLANASSDLVARMDADDICLPGRFSKAIRFLKNNKADFVFMNTILFGLSLAPAFVVPQLPIKLDVEQSRLMLALANPFAHPTLTARRAALESLGGYQNSIAEDYDLWLRAQGAGFRFIRLRGYGLLYRRHKGQLTKHINFIERVENDKLLSHSRQEYFSKLRCKEFGDRTEKETIAEISQRLSRSSVGIWLQFKLIQPIAKIMNFPL